MRTLAAILIVSCMAAVLYPMRDFILENYVFTSATSDDVRQAWDTIGGWAAIMMWLPVYNILTGSTQIKPLVTMTIIYVVPAVTKKVFVKTNAKVEAVECSQINSDKDEIISVLLEQIRAVKKENSENYESLEQCLLTNWDAGAHA